VGDGPSIRSGSVGSTPRVPPRFLLAAACSGLAYANFAVAAPLYALSLGRSTGFAAAIVALETLASVPGSVLAGALLPAVGSRNVLAAGLGGIACGAAVLLSASGPTLLVVGALVHGAGVGLFWVGSQTALGSRSGRARSEDGFVRHYAAYTVGTIAGSAATGAAAAVLRHAGLGAPASLRLSFVLGIVAAGAGVVCWRPDRLDARRPAAARLLPSGLPVRGLSVQVPDLLLVAGLALLFPLTPLVLHHSFGFSPVAVGLVVAGISVSKIVGSFVAGRLTRSRGSRTAILGMLASASGLAVALAFLGTAGLFVAVLMLAAVAAFGAWPVIVDASLARIRPAERGDVTVAWNAREWSVIAVAIASGGWVLESSSPTILLVGSAGLIGLSAAASRAVYRRPVELPEAAVA
jgi:MFS family permease